ncbi:hypothetical protein M9H77_11989 [Catharanthus roseus]|uniref:Uncharacterized protein n=1 Tax=Catharanthus roseus TaxID=4058 RepID=A0ACC0BG74_CATRO|nr:hypothetical protein M9H77_11989 [Catharanthus roseus]
MADTTKYAPINGGTLITDFKSHFQMFKTKKTVAFAYGFMFAFIAFTIFLAFSPSSNSSSPWFTNIFSVSNGGTNPSSVNSINPYLSPNFTEQLGNSTFQPLPTNPSSSGSQNSTSNQPNLSKGSLIVNNQTQNPELKDKGGILKSNQSAILAPASPVSVNQTVNTTLLNKGPSHVKNQTQTEELHPKGEILNKDQSSKGVTDYPVKANQTANSSPKSSSLEKNAAADGEKRIVEKGIVKNLTSSLVKNQSNGTNSGVSAKQGIDNLVKSLLDCQLFDGNWVRDESYPLYKPGSCSLIDEQFNCFLNGRPDNNYHKMKWKPKDCTLPRLNGSHMLEMLRGKRLVFVGDSLNRNMWESLICILRNSVKDQKKVYEASGRQHFRTEASYSFVFEDYNCTVEFFVSPFLVREWEIKDKTGKKKETLRLDMVGESAEKYKTADVIVFNTGHWWTHEKTSLGKDYYQEGSHVYSDLNVLEAFRKALTTWGRWVDANINPMNSLVFFRGYSASHFSGGQWNSGGACDHETEPIKNDTYLTPYPTKMMVLERVLKGMKTRVSYLNITRMTDYRKDGHPSIYRKQSYSDEERRSPLRFQDCSHWCLPGVPDAWNEILYAELLVNQYKKQQQQNRP